MKTYLKTQSSTTHLYMFSKFVIIGQLLYELKFMKSKEIKKQRDRQTYYFVALNGIETEPPGERYF